jgi:hypothetical protein
MVHSSARDQSQRSWFERRQKKRDEEKELNTMDPPADRILRLTKNVLKNCTIVPSDLDLPESQRGSKGRSFTEDSKKWLRPDPVKKPKAQQNAMDVDPVNPEHSSTAVPLKDSTQKESKDGVYWGKPPVECDNPVVTEYMSINGYKYIVTSLE